MSDPLIGKQLGDYVIQSLLGRGGMARVYKGYDERLQRYAAVKVINNDFSAADQAEYTERFRREARAIAHLHHPNIVGVYQFGEFEGNYYMAMVFLDGKDLRQILKEYAEHSEYMPLRDVLTIVQGMGSALDYAHSRGVIHRDIKPSNIVIDTDSRPILTDFGLALNMSEGTLGDTFGSAHYIAPEQAVSSAKAVPQSDLYSLGVCLYEMLAGKVPFDDPSAMSVALKHLNDTPPPPHLYNPALSPAIEQIVLKMLDKDPAQRYPSGAAFSQALEDAISSNRPRAGAAPEAVVANTNNTNGGASAVEGVKPTKGSAKPRRTRQPKPKTAGSATSDSRATPLKPPAMLESAGTEAADTKPPVISPAVPKEPAPEQSKPPAPAPIENRKAALPDTSPTTAPTPRRMRWLVPLIAIILVLGVGGVWASGALNSALNSGGTASPSASSQATNSASGARTQNAQASQTAVALAAVRSPAATVTVRAASPTSQTGVRTATATASPTVSRTATRTATQTASQTGTNTATASSTASATVVPATTAVLGNGGTPASRAFAVSLVYDENQIDVINLASYPLDVTNLSFVQNGKTTLRFDMPRFWPASPYSATALPSEFCYQIYRNDRPQPDSLKDCRVAAWARVADSRWFWMAQDLSVSSFDVVSGERVIATCSIKAGHCDISLS